MSWKSLLQERRLAKEAANRQELDDLIALADRNLKDAALSGLSTDGKFAFAYNAIRLLATVPIRAQGYRITYHGGAHYNTFLALPLAMGHGASSLAAYFDNCRIKRNELTYDAPVLVSSDDAQELFDKAVEFRQTVTDWLADKHPNFT